MSRQRRLIEWVSVLVIAYGIAIVLTHLGISPIARLSIVPALGVLLIFVVRGPVRRLRPPRTP